jgi:hypothetical protein
VRVEEADLIRVHQPKVTDLQVSSLDPEPLEVIDPVQARVTDPHQMETFSEDESGSEVTVLEGLPDPTTHEEQKYKATDEIEVKVIERVEVNSTPPPPPTVKKVNNLVVKELDESQERL